MSAFKAVMSSSQGINADTWTKVNFTSEDFDDDGDFDLANDRFQPDVEGYYRITARVRWITEANDDLHQLMLTRNGSYLPITRHSSHANGSGYTEEVNAIVYLNGSTNWIDARVKHDGDYGKTIANGEIDGEFIDDGDTLSIFLGRLNTTQSISSGAANQVLFATEEFDTQSEYNHIFGKFIPQTAGKYRLTAHINWVSPPSGTQLEVQIRRNGTVISRQINESPGGTRYTQEVNTLFGASADDEFTVYVSQDSGSAINIDGVANNWMSYFCGNQLDDKYFFGQLNTDWDYEASVPVPFDANYYDPYNIFDTTTGYFEPDEDGKYRLTAQLEVINDGATYYQIFLISNVDLIGSTVVFAVDSSTPTITLAYNTLVDVDICSEEWFKVTIIGVKVGEDTVVNASFTRSFFNGEKVD